MKQNFSTMNEVTKVDEFCFHCYNNNTNNDDNNKKLQQQPGPNNLLSHNPVYPQSLTRPINNTLSEAVSCKFRTETIVNRQ